MIPGDLLSLLIIVVWVLTTVFVVLFYSLTVGLSFFGIRRYEPPPKSAPWRRFCVVIPAHNEGHVLGQLLDDLHHLEYPAELVDLYVIADNCTDDTARVARAAGAQVIEKHGNNGSKGKAIAYALRALLGPIEARRGVRYDAVAFFDADNRVAPDFLALMHAELDGGARFIQGYLGVKNPEANWLTRVIHISYLTTNRLWQLGRRRVGLSGQCGGTGVCIDASLLRDRDWPTRTLTEDLELTCQLALEGTYLTWCHGAKVFDEKPTSVRVVYRQRVRWMRGHLRNLRLYFVPLIRRGLRERDVRAVEIALYLLSPLFLLSVSLQGILWAVNEFLWPTMPMVGRGLAATLLVTAVLVYYPLMGIYLETRSLRPALYLPFIAIFNWIWVGAVYHALLTLGDDRWYHTPHSPHQRAEARSVE